MVPCATCSFKMKPSCMLTFCSDDLPFEFRALELALELVCMSLDTQV